MEHTPGPWENNEKADGTGRRVIHSPDGLLIAVVPDYGNSLLITAAPELLEALGFVADALHKAANGGFTAAGERWTVGKLKNLIRNCRDVAESAIAKVEGGKA